VGRRAPLPPRPKQGRHDFLPVSIQEDVSGFAMLCGKAVSDDRVPDLSSEIFSIVGGWSSCRKAVCSLGSRSPIPDLICSPDWDVVYRSTHARELTSSMSPASIRSLPACYWYNRLSICKALTCGVNHSALVSLSVSRKLSSFNQRAIVEM
jgi:hypothetical protein